MNAARKQRQVHYQRLHQGQAPPAHVRIAARVVCHALARLFLLGISLFSRLRGVWSKSPRSPNRPARVVLTGTFFADGWVEAHVRPLAAAMPCEHLWVVSDGRFLPMDNVTYVCPPRWLQKLIGRVPARSLMLVLTAVWHRADVVGGFHLLCNGLLALLVARMLGARAMYFCVGGWAEFVGGGVHGGNQMFTRIGRGDDRLERLLLDAVRQFDLILTMGTGARDLLLDRGVNTPVQVMSGGLDPSVYAMKTGRRRYDLITVSRIVPVKRLDVFLEVVRLIAREVPTVTAVVVGDGSDLESIKQQVVAGGLSAQITFVGRQKRVQDWLADSRLFVLTSDSEGLSLALMEAMMSGLPAVVSDVGDLGDLVTDGVNGWMVPPQQAELFAKRITRLLTDEDSYQACAAEARRAALAKSVEAATGQWDDLLSRWGFRPSSANRTPCREATLAWPLSRKRLWEHSRRFTRNPAARVLSAVSPPVWLGRRCRRNLRFLRKADSWSRDEQVAYQLAELRRVVSLAYRASPYYRQLYRLCGFEPGDLRVLEDLAELPTINAETVRNHLAGLCSRQRIGPRADLIATSGTGGAPLRFYMGADRSAVEYAHLVVSWERIGYRLGIPLAVFRGRIVPSNQAGLRHEYDPLLRHHHYSSFHMTDEDMRRHIEHVRRIGPCFLHVYPSSIAVLAHFLRRSGLTPPKNVRGIIAESESVYPAQRRMVEEVFGCRYFSCYGHTEKLVLAAECEHSDDYHVWPTYGYFELLDEQGRAVTTPGERGEIVGTGFINTLTPFIRYRTGDWATYMGDRCAVCGRSQPIISDIRGHRTQETLVASDGSLVSWVALNMHDDTFEHVRQFQFCQDVPGRAVLRIVPAEDFRDEDRSRILARLAEKLDARLNLTIELSESIPLSERGKAIYVDQRIPETSMLGDHRTDAQVEYHH